MASGAPIYLENKEGQTACDIADKKNFREIAEFLETKMVFNVSNDYSYHLFFIYLKT